MPPPEIVNKNANFRTQTYPYHYGKLRESTHPECEVHWRQHRNAWPEAGWSWRTLLPEKHNGPHLIPI
jgi:hypothetical protein